MPLSLPIREVSMSGNIGMVGCGGVAAHNRVKLAQYVSQTARENLRTVAAATGRSISLTLEAVLCTLTAEKADEAVKTFRG